MLNKKMLGIMGLAFCLLLFVVGISAGLFAAPKELLTGLGLLPFAVGAIKVRDDIEKVRTIKYVHASATTKDTIYIIDGIPMLAVNSAGAGEANIYVKAGLIEYLKLNTQVWVGGDKLFWDAGNSRFGNLYDPSYIFAGYAAEAAANPTTTGFIILTPGASRNTFAKVTTDTTAGALTMTAAMLLGGIILRDPNGAGRSDVTPTAAQLVAAIPGCIVGSAFEFTVRNTADGAETTTETAGSGVTLSGTMTIAQSNSKRFLVVIDNATAAAEAATMYSLGTIVH